MEYRKSILFTGTTGMVGYYIDATAWHLPIMKTTRKDFDIQQEEEVRRYFAVHHETTAAIVHLAAETDMDKCEQDFDHALRVNVLGTQNLVYEALRYNLPMLYVSTVGIFGGDGSCGPFHEFSTPYPANRYGWTKLYGEQIVKDCLTRYFIVRAGWMMGAVEKDKKFVMKIVRQLKEGKREIFAVNDVMCSPTYAKEFLATIAALVQTDFWGTYHCTNNGQMSPYDVAKVICEELAPAVPVRPVTSDYFKLPAPRAISAGSENRMLTLRGMNQMSTVESALRTYLAEIKAAGIITLIPPRV